MLQAATRRAKAGAMLWLVIGCAIAAVAAFYVAVIAAVFSESFPLISFVFVCAIGVIPLLVGLPIALGSLIRLRLLGRVSLRPEMVTGGELAMRWGRPALRLHFSDGRSVVLATGDADRNAMIGAIKLPNARVVR